MAILLILVAQGCALLDHARQVKHMKKLDAASYSKIQVGQAQNFTALNLRIFNRQGSEVSHADDPHIQAQISNQGDVAYYSDNTAGQVLKFSARPVPSELASNWDKIFVLDASSIPTATSSTPNLVYVSTDGPKDFFAGIDDQGTTLTYKDASVPLTAFEEQPMPPNIHPDFDAFFLTKDTKYGILRSLKKGTYRLLWQEEGTKSVHTFDFRPLAYGLQSTTLGLYRGVVYNPQLQEWMVEDFIPTQKLICFDIARAYDTASSKANRETTRAALQAILTAIAGYSTTSFSGTGQSTYSGYYAGYSLTGTGTSSYSGYAQTYDYRYLAAGASSLLDTIFQGSATLDNIKAAAQQQNCELEF
jgi:hypothetical protein